MASTPATANSKQAWHFWDRSGAYYPAANSDYNYPASLPPYTATPKTSAGVTSSKPKTTTASKAPAGQTATSSAPTVSSEQSAVTSGEVSSTAEEEDESSESSEIIVTTQNTNINGGIKEFFIGSMMNLYQKNKLLFIIAIVGTVVLVLSLAGGFVFFLRRRKITHGYNHTPFGGSYLN